MRRLDVSSEAELEIFEAALRYERERPGVGLRFEADVSGVFVRVLENPFQFPEIDEGTRRALVRHFPYGFRTASFFPWKTTSSPCLRCFTCIGIQTRGNEGAGAQGEERACDWLIAPCLPALLSHSPRSAARPCAAGWPPTPSAASSG